MLGWRVSRFDMWWYGTRYDGQGRTGCSYDATMLLDSHVKAKY